MPTPGAAPRGRTARGPQEACRGPRRASRSRRASRTPRAPDRVRRSPSNAGSRRCRSTCRPRPAPRSTATSACCSRGPTAINLTGDPRPGSRRDRPRRRQPDRRRRPPRPWRRPVRRPRLGRRLPGPPAGRGTTGRACAPARADRQEGALPVDGHRCHRAGHDRRGGARAGPRPSPPIDATAAAGRRSRARAVAPLAEPRRAGHSRCSSPVASSVAWKRGELGRRAGRRAPGAGARWAAGRSNVRDGPRPRPATATELVIVTRWRARRRPRTRAIPAARKRRPW